MLTSETRAFVRYFLRRYPRRTAAMVALLLLAGLAEGVGIATLLPVLELAVGEPGGGSALSRAAAAVVSALGLEPALGPLLALFVAALTLKALFRWAAMRQVGYTVARVAADLRLDLVRSLLAARWGFFIGERAGHLASAVGTEAYRASSAYRRAGTAFAVLIQLAVYGVAIVLVSWRIALAALAVGLAVSVVLNRFVGQSRRAGEEQTDAYRSLAGGLTDVVRGIKPIKAMGRESLYLPFFERETGRLESAERLQVHASEALFSFQEPLVALVVAVLVYLAVTLGGPPFSTILLLVFLFHRFVGRVHSIQTEYQGVVVGESALRVILDRTRAAREAVESTGGGRPPPPLRESITLERVSFDHDGTPVLRDVSLRIDGGSLTVVTGPSGAGKTTLVDLITGLLRPTSGEIRIDGEPLSTLDRTAWRRAIGYVPQETLLLHDTVAANVGLGSAEADAARIEEALDRAGVLRFVRSNPQGLDAVVGEHGWKLSGGQRQRIAIARALVLRPRLLVLDEALTGLDPETANRIAATLRSLDDVTILAISHRPEMERIADRVLVVENGGAVGEAGPGPRVSGARS